MDQTYCTHTGKASVEKPWLNYYPEHMRRFAAPHMTLSAFLQEQNQDHDKPTIEYYGGRFSLNRLLAEADKAARALAALGVKEGDEIPVFLSMVPEFFVLLLAAEKIGAALICRDGTVEENQEAVRRSGAKVLFAHDFLSMEELELDRQASSLEHVVLVSPYRSAVREEVPDYVARHIAGRYPEHPAGGEECMDWDTFLAGGEGFTGSYEAPADPDRSLYHPYTSGSTGPSKELIHTAASMEGVISQLIIPSPVQISWRVLLCLLPPSLIAMVSPMVLYRIATTDLIILSPFCDEKDIDLEFLRHKPNLMMAIPMMAEILMESKRIPEDYDMSFMLVMGGGADPMHNKFLRRVQDFLAKHGSPATYSMCYGLSEAGSTATNPHANSSFMDCGSGIPMQGVVISVFEKDSQKELDYGQLGEICVQSPGNMAGYTDPEATAKTLQRHPDGLLWVHTGDFGYMNEKGELFVLGRGLTERYGGGYLFCLPMENKVVEVPGVEDCFVVTVPDKEHPGYFLPYLFLVPEDGAVLEDLEKGIHDALEPHERPVRITLIKHREYFHFKTNRRVLAAQIMSE